MESSVKAEKSSDDEKKVKLELKPSAHLTVKDASMALMELELLQAEQRKSRSLIEESKNRHDKQMKELCDKDRSLRQRDGELILCKAKYAKLRKLHDSKSNESVDVSSKLARSLEEITELKRKVSPLGSENVRLRKEISQLKKQQVQNHTQSSTLSEKDDEVRALKRELLKVESELLKVNKVKNPEIVVMKAVVVDAMTQKVNANQKLCELEHQMVEQIKSHKTLELEYTILLSKYNSLQSENSRLTKVHTKLTDRVRKQGSKLRELQENHSEILEESEGVFKEAVDTGETPSTGAVAKGLHESTLSEPAKIANAGSLNGEENDLLAIPTVLGCEGIMDIQHLTSDFENEPLHAELIREAMNSGVPNNERDPNTKYACRLCLVSCNKDRFKSHIIKTRQLKLTSGNNPTDLADKLNTLRNSQASPSPFSECGVMRLLLQKVIDATHQFDSKKIDAFMTSYSTASTRLRTYHDQIRKFPTAEKKAIYGIMAEMWSKTLMVAEQEASASL